MKIVLIEWDDASSNDAWHDRDCSIHITPCVSCGVLTREDNKEVEVALNINSYSKSDFIAIPRGCIRRIRTLCLK